MKRIFLLPVLLLLAAGCQKARVSTSFPPPQPLPQFNNKADVDTANWKTYANEQYGFSVQHPQDWFVVSEERGSIEMLSFSTAQAYGSSPLPIGEFQITITPEWATNNKENIAAWCRKQLSNYRYSPNATIKIVDERPITVARLPAYVIDSRAMYAMDGKVINDKGQGDRQVCIAKGDTKLGIIGRPLNSQYLPVFDRILATFTFVK